MEKVYKHIRQALIHNEELVVARIIDTKGSVPRKAGATMMMSSKGEFYGTVGGGIAEKHACDTCMEVLRSKTGCVKTYSSSAGDHRADDMLCGGSVTIEFIYVAEDNETFRKELERAVDEDRRQRVRVWIAGAGHVAQALVPVLSSIGFDCRVFDDRPELLTEEVFPEASERYLIDYKKVSGFVEENVGERDFVCIMTKGHKDDYESLKPALRSPAYYVGLMGSRSKVKSLYTALRGDGFTEAQIEKCHSPIGIKISAETPLEVAISVASELIYKRALMEGRNKY